MNIEFKVVPRICILPEGSVQCEESVQVEWKADQQRSLCLYLAGVDEALQCWQDTDEGRAQYPLLTANSVQFELRDYDNSLLVLASAEFKVMHDKKKYRRSRRNPWSFF